MGSDEVVTHLVGNKELAALVLQTKCYEKSNGSTSGQALGLKWSDLNVEDCTLLVERQVQ